MRVVPLPSCGFSLRGCSVRRLRTLCLLPPAAPGLRLLGCFHREDSTPLEPAERLPSCPSARLTVCLPACLPARRRLQPVCMCVWVEDTRTRARTNAHHADRETEKIHRAENVTPPQAPPLGPRCRRRAARHAKAH